MIPQREDIMKLLTREIRFSGDEPNMDLVKEVMDEYPKTARDLHSLYLVYYDKEEELNGPIRRRWLDRGFEMIRNQQKSFEQGRVEMLNFLGIKGMEDCEQQSCVDRIVKDPYRAAELFNMLGHKNTRLLWRTFKLAGKMLDAKLRECEATDRLVVYGHGRSHLIYVPPEARLFECVPETDVCDLPTASAFFVQPTSEDKLRYNVVTMADAMGLARDTKPYYESAARAILRMASDLIDEFERSDAGRVLSNAPEHYQTALEKLRAIEDAEDARVIAKINDLEASGRHREAEILYDTFLDDPPLSPPSILAKRKTLEYMKEAAGGSLDKFMIELSCLVKKIDGLFDTYTSSSQYYLYIPSLQIPSGLEPEFERLLERLVRLGSTLIGKYSFGESERSINGTVRQYLVSSVYDWRARVIPFPLPKLPMRILFPNVDPWKLDTVLGFRPPKEEKSEVREVAEVSEPPSLPSVLASEADGIALTPKIEPPKRVEPPKGRMRTFFETHMPTFARATAKLRLVR